MNNKDLILINNAMAFAIKVHHETNHLYDNYPYSLHLGIVANFGWKYLYLLPENLRNIAIACCWTHDSIEDARQTFNDVKKATNENVALISAKLTNYTRGISRKERMPDWLYKEIQEDSVACFVKICDRLANVYYSMITNNSMFSKYKEESDGFKSKLYRKEFEIMFHEMDEMLK